MSINATTTRARPATLPGRPGVPWSTVLPLAVVFAYADGYWMVSLRGAVGAIERTQGPFASWLRESTLVLPVFVVAVLGALTLALHLFGPVLRTWKTVLATTLMVVAAGTLAGIAEMVASSAYDYHLQTSQLKLMASMGGTCAGANCLPQQLQASLVLQVHAVGYGSAILLATNLILVGWAVAIRGGRLNVSTTRTGTAQRLPQPAPQGQQHHSRVGDLRLLLAAGLIASAAIHAAVVPEHLTGWAALSDPTSAGVFFIALTAAELAVAARLLARPQTNVLPAAIVVSIGPLALWMYAQIAGTQFGPAAGVPGRVDLADWAALTLEAGTLLIAVILLRRTRSLQRRPPTSAHIRWLFLVTVIAITAIGLTASGLPGLDDFGSSNDQMVMSSSP